MAMKQELQINRYFDHAMSSGEEQNFLISLAASDEMRIAFRSHLELMKAVRDDKDGLRSVAQVRTRTLTALGLSATAVMPFIEQELVRNARPLESPAGKADHLETASIGGSSNGGFLSGLLRKPKYVLGTGVMLGFLGAVTLMNLMPSGPSPSLRVVTGPTPATQTVAAPSVQQPLNSAKSETIPAGNSLNSEQESRASETAVHSSAARTAASPGKPDNSRVIAATPSVTGRLPEVNIAGQSRMRVKKTIIQTPTKDSVEAH